MTATRFTLSEGRLDLSDVGVEVTEEQITIITNGGGCDAMAANVGVGLFGLLALWIASLRSRRR